MSGLSAIRFGLLVAILVASPALANERHFTFTYESAVLPEGARELELWFSPRIGRDTLYNRFDQRIELEFGITERLMGAVYVNGTSTTQAGVDGLDTQFQFGGLSLEAKYKLLDPMADAFGLALYAEATGWTHEYEVEAKLIADKRLGNLLLATNLVAEHEWKLGLIETERELALDWHLGGSYFITENFTAGLEARLHNAIPAGEGLEHSVLYAGPVLSYAQKGWWIAATFQAQLPALAGATEGTSLVLDGHERYNARLLFAFHL